MFSGLSRIERMRRPRFRLAALMLLLGACSGASDEAIEPPTPFPGRSPFAYPPQLVDLDAEGQTVLMVHVTTAGVVDSVYVLEPARWSAFDSSALAGARQLRFSPGKQGSRRLAMWTRLPVRFAADTAGTIGLTSPVIESNR
jgi:TonB family protein